MVIESLTDLFHSLDILLFSLQNRKRVSEGRSRAGNSFIIYSSCSIEQRHLIDDQILTQLTWPRHHHDEGNILRLCRHHRRYHSAFAVTDQSDLFRIDLFSTL